MVLAVQCILTGAKDAEAVVLSDQLQALHLLSFKVLQPALYL